MDADVNKIIKKKRDELKKKKRLIDGRISSLKDTLWHYALWCGYDKVEVVCNFIWLDIFVFQGEKVAKVSVAYEELIETNYTTLMDKIKEAINVSFEGGQDK